MKESVSLMSEVELNQNLIMVGDKLYYYDSRTLKLGMLLDNEETKEILMSFNYVVGNLD